MITLDDIPHMTCRTRDEIEAVAELERPGMFDAAPRHFRATRPDAARGAR